MTHICVSKLTIISSDNGLSPDQHQAIIWSNDEILLIGPLGTNFNEILIGSQTFSLKKMHLKMSSGKWRPFCLSLNVLTYFTSRPYVLWVESHLISTANLLVAGLLLDHKKIIQASSYSLFYSPKAVVSPHSGLTLKWLGHFFQNGISLSDAVHLICNIFIWNWSYTVNV